MNRTATLRKMLIGKEIGILDSCYSSLPEGSFAEKIYKFRMLNGLSREAFAKQIKVHFTAVQSWECGICVPRKKNLKKICDTFGLDASYFEFMD